MKTIKIFLLTSILFFSMNAEAFHAKLIIVVPKNTTVYVNNQLFQPQNDGTYKIKLGKAKTLNIKYVCEGYVTKDNVYIYNRKQNYNPQINFYKRGTNYFSVELIKQ